MAQMVLREVAGRDEQEGARVHQQTGLSRAAAGPGLLHAIAGGGTQRRKPRLQPGPQRWFGRLQLLGKPTGKLGLSRRHRRLFRTPRMLGREFCVK